MNSTTPAPRFDWITALRAPAIAKLAADDGPLQMSLFDTHDLAEITHPDYPGERLIACRNPALAAERARKRERPAHATEKDLAHIAERVTRARSPAPGEIGKAVGKVSGKYKVGKHFHLTITDTGFTSPRPAAIDAEAALDGIYVLRTSVARRRPRPRRRGRQLQETRQCRTRLPQHQIRRPRSRPIHHRLTSASKPTC